MPIKRDQRLYHAALWCSIPLSRVTTQKNIWKVSLSPEPIAEPCSSESVAETPEQLSQTLAWYFDRPTIVTSLTLLIGEYVIIGYARTSTREQVAGFEAQIKALRDAGCEKVFQEQVSAVKQREQLDAALDFVREGDVFVVTKLDRLARSVAHLCQLVDQLKAKGVTLKILAIGLDSGTPTGNLMLNMLAAIAQFEREMMLERQLDGIEAAKTAGRYKGRKPTARAKSDEVTRLIGDGCTRREVAHRLGIGVASVYRILADSTSTQVKPGNRA